MTSRAGVPLLAAVLATGVLGCGGSPTAPQDDVVYYLHDRGVIDRRYSWERYYPPLDRDEGLRVPRRVGVAIFDGDVRMSRPIDWYLRTADYTPEQRFISYQSPRQFVFNIYERIDPVEETWDEVLKRYEEDVEQKGSVIVAGRIPVASANTQGRSYLIETNLEAKPEPFGTMAHEIILRTDNRVMLVQIVHGERIDESIDEMTQALRSILVY
ncbi:MAG: hypothetical protein RIF41_26200 [Polyangiaceae bacterium]